MNIVSSLPCGPRSNNMHSNTEIPTVFNPRKDESSPATATMLQARFQVKVPAVISSMTDTSQNVLEVGYQPSPNDVKCGRGKGSYNRPGNIKFRQTVENFMPAYLQCKTVIEKTCLLNAVVDRFQEEHQGRFIRQAGKGDSRRWIELSREEARAKVGHAMRQVMAVAQKNASGANETTAVQDMVKALQTPLVDDSNSNKAINPLQTDALDRGDLSETMTRQTTTAATAENSKEDDNQSQMTRYEELVARIVQQRKQNPLFVLAP